MGSDWDEIKRLAADFQKAQLTSTLQKLATDNQIAASSYNLIFYHLAGSLNGIALKSLLCCWKSSYWMLCSPTMARNT